MTYIEAYRKHEKLLPGRDPWVIHRCAILETDGICVHPFDCHEISAVLSRDDGRVAYAGAVGMTVPQWMDAIEVRRPKLSRYDKEAIKRLYASGVVSCRVCGGWVNDGPVDIHERRRIALAAIIQDATPGSWQGD